MRQEYVIDKVMNFYLLKAMDGALQGSFQLWFQWSPGIEAEVRILFRD